MGFRNPITTAEDPTARAAAAAAQSTANNAQTSANNAQSTANDAENAAGNAQGTANSALSIANGKTTTYLRATAPVAPAGGFTKGDTWIDTTNLVLKTWNGSAWQAQQWGSQALTAGAVIAGTIAAGAIDGMTITGATIQTAASGQAARLYEKTTTSGGQTTTQGILEFPDGIGDDPASVTATAIVSSGVGQGGSMTVGGGSFNGTPAPKHSYAVEQAPAGGYQGALHLSNALYSDLGGAYISGAGTPPKTAVGAAAGWGVSTGGFGVYKDASGAVHLYGDLANSNAFTPVGGELLATLPAGFRPLATKFYPVPISVGQTVIHVNIGTDGTVKIARPYSTQIPALTVWGFDLCNFLPA